MDYYGDTMRWFVGTVANNLDPLKIGRVQVRIHGIHSALEAEIPTYDLPFAQVVLPTTEGGTSGIGKNPFLQPGAQVVGFFLDGPASQNPIIIGSIPHVEITSEVQKSQISTPEQQVGFEAGRVQTNETLGGGRDAADIQRQTQLLGVGSPEYPPDCSDAWITSVITRECQRRYIDPVVALGVYAKEGKGSYQSSIAAGPNLAYNGREASFGPFQLYIGGGLGNEYGEKVNGDTTGRILISDNNRLGIQRQIQFSLDRFIKDGNWNKWHGWKGAPDAGLNYRGKSKPKDFV